MSWIKMMFVGPANLLRYFFFSEPRVTWEMIEHNRCEEIQVKCMLQSTRDACNTCLDAYAYAMLQEQVVDLDERYKGIIVDRNRLNARALKEGLMLDKYSSMHC
jgi:hypothetical protein